MKISACIPCFNNRDTIARAVASIRAQSFPVDEIIVIDDGSTDQPAESPEARVIRLEKNIGRGGARARAMREARHELVLFCDATIALDAEFAKNALPWFGNEKVAAVFGCVKQPTPRNAAERWRGRHLFKNEPPREPNRRATLATGGAILRAQAVARAGGFKAALREREDADLGARLLAAGFDVVCDPRLFATALKTNTVREVLERYARWNTDGPMSARDYAKQIVYSIKVMARADLRERDPLAAFISLASPHFQFLRSRRNHDFRNRKKFTATAFTSV